MVSEVIVFLLQSPQLSAGMGEADEELLDPALILVRLCHKAGLYLSLEKSSSSDYRLVGFFPKGKNA